ncbi:Undecaprenyl-phosphate glucose phosphotransferase [Clostridium algifaecis]|uniref:Undecaprenyl-phosphate glucose phosphotransferase n=1 Tax=Clostridium algifaecis TaxID=1472040 RepID=A0ABS4KQA3_9CLOT|nr:undecaprenyl-phosphate glucose phosphotransferase [Clostridium algifaecis]MBP2032221.1 Undecaprenyl-phosphate glucose phosphotransferase [Clostridium algifaecis]
MIKENQKHLNKLLVGIDVVVIFLAINAACYIRFNYINNGLIDDVYSFNYYILPLILMIPIYIVIFNMMDLYSTHRLKSILSEVSDIVKCNICGIVIFVVMLYFLKRINYSRFLIVIFFLLATSFMCIERVCLRSILRSIRRKGYNVKHILFIGINNMTCKLIKQIQQNKHWGYDIKGILYDKELEKSFEEIASDSTTKVGIEYKNCIIDNMDILEKYLLSPDIDEVFITLPFSHYDKINKIIHICEKAGVPSNVIPDFLNMVSSKPYIEEIGNIPMIGMRYVPLDNLFNRMIKRTFDIILSSIAILITSPIMLLTVLIIKVTSPGHVIFKQERVGLNKKVFTMYKFRSMHVQKASEEKVEWTTENDPRKTKFGSFIRKTSIDELPQFFNVLKGDMSMIGPRPERPYFVDKFKDEVPKYMVKHQVRPGITGWAQVNGWRGDTSIDKRIQCDIYYIENWSFILDLKIVFLTFFKGFINKNAY